MKTLLFYKGCDKGYCQGSYRFRLLPVGKLRSSKLGL